MADTLVLPALGGLIFLFLIYIGFAWVRPKDKRALTILDTDEDEDSPPSSY